MSDENGVRWLVEERDRLKARVAVLEDELVRRDAAVPFDERSFFLEVDPLYVRQVTVEGRSTRAIADRMAGDLALEIVKRALHQIRVMPDGSLRLYFLVNAVSVDALLGAT